MALWLVRTGRHGEYEQKFIATNRIYLTWNNLTRDLQKADSKKDLQAIVHEIYPNSGERKVIHHATQMWQFAKSMKVGDLIVVPMKTKPAINIAEITGQYVYDPSAEDPFYHYREIKWLGKDIPRTRFDKDLLYSFGAFMTICEIARNDAEKRVRKIIQTVGRPEKDDSENNPIAEGPIVDEVPDLEELARDGIAQLVIQKHKGHGLARLVDAILQAQGYTTYCSPEGPDKGIDILAAPGPLGFGTPRMCVQVKSGDGPVDLPTLNQLIGAMQNVQAEQGLLVAWGGFKSSIDKEVPLQFFRVRLWNQNDLIRELLVHYDKLDEDIRAELPLKRIWTVATQDDDE